MKAKKFLHDGKGQSIVEIALITPLILAALYVVIDFGIAIFTAHYTQNAAREGTRIGAVLRDCSTVASGKCVQSTSGGCPVPAPVAGTPDDKQVIREVCNRKPALLSGATVTVTLSGAMGDACRRMVTVSVAGCYNYGWYNFLALIGKPLTGGAKTLSITRAATARYELQPVTNYTTSC